MEEKMWTMTRINKQRTWRRRERTEGGERNRKRRDREEKEEEISFHTN